MTKIKLPDAPPLILDLDRALSCALQPEPEAIQRARSIGLTANQREVNDLSEAMLIAGATVLEEFSAYYEERALASMVYSAMLEANLNQSEKTGN